MRFRPLGVCFSEVGAGIGGVSLAFNESCNLDVNSHGFPHLALDSEIVDTTKIVRLEKQNLEIRFRKLTSELVIISFRLLVEFLSLACGHKILSGLDHEPRCHVVRTSPTAGEEQNPVKEPRVNIPFPDYTFIVA